MDRSSGLIGTVCATVGEETARLTTTDLGAVIVNRQWPQLPLPSVVQVSCPTVLVVRLVSVVASVTGHGGVHCVQSIGV